MRTCTQMDGVHPRARECETGSATLVDTLPWTTPPEMVMLATALGPMTSSGEDIKVLVGEVFCN